MKFLFFLGLLLAFIGTKFFFIYRSIIGDLPVASYFEPPSLTSWRPKGLRVAPLSLEEDRQDWLITPTPNTFRTMHVGGTNEDNIWTVGAPMFEFAWSVEPDLYVAEGPTLDNQGNLYFSPLNPRENVSLVSLDAKTGERRWSLPGAGPAFGAPLILNNPADPAGHLQIIYHATYSDAYALHPNGTIIWHAPTHLPARENGEQLHMWGLNYHAATDSLLGLSLAGDMFGLDRTTGELTVAPFHLPCSPAMSSEAARPPSWVVWLGDRETDRAFGKLPNGKSVFSAIVDVIFGGGGCVSNFFAVDPLSGLVLVAATAPDTHDGTEDGLASDGALYSLSLAPTPPRDSLRAQLTIDNVRYFSGGTGSTPTVSADGRRVYVSDDAHHVLALSLPDLELLWQVDVGEQVTRTGKRRTTHCTLNYSFKI
jgi:outer membrane protein assembly factor BamB